MEEMIAECTQMMNSMNSMMGEGMVGMMGGGMTPGGMMGSTMAPWWILGWLLVIAVYCRHRAGDCLDGTASRRSRPTRHHGDDHSQTPLRRRRD
jgi:hypothetical protein